MYSLLEFVLLSEAVQATVVKESIFAVLSSLAVQSACIHGYKCIFFVCLQGQSYCKSGWSWRLRCHTHPCQCLCFSIPWQHKYAPDHSWSRTIWHISANVTKAHNCSADANYMTGPGEIADIQHSISLTISFGPFDSAEWVWHWFCQIPGVL